MAGAKALAEPTRATVATILVNCCLCVFGCGVEE